MSNTKRFKIVQIVEISDSGKTSRIIENSIKPLDTIDGLFELTCSLLEDRLGLVRVPRNDYTGFKRSLGDREFVFVVIPSESEEWLTFCVDAELINMAKMPTLDTSNGNDRDLLSKEKDSDKDSDKQDDFDKENDLMRVFNDDGEGNKLFPHTLNVSIRENKQEFLLDVLRAIESVWESYAEMKDKKSNKMKSMNMLHNSFPAFDRSKLV